LKREHSAQLSKLSFDGFGLNIMASCPLFGERLCTFTRTINAADPELINAAGRLLEAAPELLAALNACADRMRELSGPCGKPIELILAEAAILKAGGAK
jgi:hypothetical protein